MPAPSQSSHLDGIRADVAELQSAVDEALHVAYEAIKRVQQLRDEGVAGRSSPPPPQALSEADLHDHLRAFEAFILERVREETARAALLTSRPVEQNKNLADSNAASVPCTSSVSERKMELKLEAQRTRTTAMEQRLRQLEAKLNALMTDVVSQSQREAAHHRQLASMVHEQVDAEMSAAAAACGGTVEHEGESTISRVSPPPPSGVVDASVMHHVAVALAALHERVEEQHAELTHWQQQHFAMMSAVVKQLNEVKEENASLRQQLFRLQGHP